MATELSKPTTFDDLIQPVIEDEVTSLATQELTRLKTGYEPKVYEALALKHTIPHDPVALGLAQFNQRLAYLNADITNISQLLALLIFEKRQAQDRKQKAKSAYEERLHILVNHDETVRDAEGGQKGREIAAKGMMQREQRLVDYCEQIYTTILQYHESVKLVLDTLKETKRDNMNQLAVIKEQIRAGEVNSSSFPVETVSPPTSPGTDRTSALEAEIREILPSGEGHTQF